MISEKKVIRVTGIAYSIILILGLIYQQKGWIEYAVNQGEYSVVKAKIIDEIHSTFRRDVVLRYEKDTKMQEKTVVADMRDSLGEEIKVAIDEDGEILRTTLFFPDNFEQWYCIILLIIVIIACCFGNGI